MSRSALVRNAGDPQQVRFAARKERARQAQYWGALETVLKTPAGRLLLWEVLRRTGLYATSIPAAGEPGSNVYVNEGRRLFGLELLGDLQRFEEFYLLMEREARSLEAQQEREIAAYHQAAAGGQNG